MQALTGFQPLDPATGGTFVTHHMVFHKKYVTELLDLMVKTTSSDLPWPLLIMSYSRLFYRFSEYKTYATYMLRYHPDQFHFHPLSMFGEGGLRFRESNEVIEEMLTACRFSNGGLAYTQVKDFFLSKQKRQMLVSDDEKAIPIPAYVQLDHVYGLDGVDLNLAGPIPASRETFSLRAFSQLKEIRSLQDIPDNLFLEPVNVAVVRDCGGVVDDSVIQRMTIGSVMRSPFAHRQLTNQTTPRRPLQQKYYLGAGGSMSSQNTPTTCGLTSHSSSCRSTGSLDSYDDDTVDGLSSRSSSSSGRTPSKHSSVQVSKNTLFNTEDNLHTYVATGRHSIFSLFLPLKAVVVPSNVTAAVESDNSTTIISDTSTQMMKVKTLCVKV